MRRKAVTVLELAVIGCFLIMGSIVFANRNKPKCLEYPPAAVVRSPLALPLDTPRIKPAPHDFSASTQRMLDSLIRAKDKRQDKRFSGRAQAMIDSAMQVEASKFFQQQPVKTRPGLQWHVEKITADSSRSKQLKASSHGKQH